MERRERRPTRDRREGGVDDVEAEPLIEGDVGGICGLEAAIHAFAVRAFEDRYTRALPSPCRWRSGRTDITTRYQRGASRCAASTPAPKRTKGPNARGAAAMIRRKAGVARNLRIGVQGNLPGRQPDCD